MLNMEAQTAVGLESAEGVELDLTNVANIAAWSGNRKDSSHSYGHGEYERDLERATLTLQQPLKSMYTGGVSFTEELCGGTATQEAPWTNTLKGLGWVKVGNLVEFDVSGGGGAQAQYGDRVGVGVSEGVATKRAIVAWASASKIVIAQTFGAAITNTETLTNFTRTGSYALSGTATNKGHHYVPVTERTGAVVPSCTVERRLGGQRHTFVGSRGTGSISMRENEPILLQAQFTGVPKFATGTLKPREAGLVTGVPALTNPPAPTIGVPMSIRVGSSSWTPVLTEIEIALANTLANRSTVTDVDIDNTGYLPTRITGRTYTARINPEHILPGEGFDILQTLHDSTRFELVIPHGQRSDANGQVIFYAGRCSLIGDYEPGDKDGVTLSPLTIGMYGDDNDELRIFHLFA